MHDQSWSYTCAKAFGSCQPPKSCEWSQHAGFGSLQSPSEWSPESSGRTACRNHSDFQGAWKFWACWYPFGSAFIISDLWADHVRTVLIFPNSHSDSCRQNPFLTGWPADFSTLWCVSFGFLRSVTNAAKRLPECVVCKKNTRQRCPSSLRTDRLLPVSHEWPMAQSLSQKWTYDVSVKRQQWHAMTTSNDSVTRLCRLIDCLL